jgi:aminoglycoside phosphotransferase (APT) family kinase protein
MARTGRPKTELTLTEGEHEQLVRWSRRAKSSQALALRSKIVLACAKGTDNKDVAAQLNCAVATVGKWRSRFVAERLDGLLDEPRPGRPATISVEAVEAVVVATLEETPQNATHWSRASMAKRSGLSKTTIGRIWEAFELKPHRVDGFKLHHDRTGSPKTNREDGSTPDLARFREVHSGFSSRILRSADLCVRQPRSAAAARRHETEAKLLAAVGDAFAVDVPATLRRLPPSAEFPLGAHLVRWLEGQEVDASVAPGSIGDFVHGLHGIDLGRVAALLPDFGQWCQRQRKLEAAGLTGLEGRVERGLLDGIRELMTRLGDGIETGSRPCLIHGDLWYGNLLMRQGRLSGVLDWEFAAIGDPLVDYAALWYLGDDFMSSFLGSLRQSVQDLPESIKYYRILREFHGLIWSIENADHEELEESIEKVTQVARSVLA